MKGITERKKCGTITIEEDEKDEAKFLMGKVRKHSCFMVLFLHK